MLSRNSGERTLFDDKADGPQKGCGQAKGAGLGATGGGWDSGGPALPPFGLLFFVLSPLQLGFSVEKVHVVGQEVGAEGSCLMPPGPGGSPPWVPDPLDKGNRWREKRKIWMGREE